VDKRDVIGERGESIFRVLLTRKHPSRGYLFDHPRFLGEKKQTIDFYVELFHEESLVPFFFVQVKSTSEGYSSKEQRLNQSSGYRHGDETPCSLSSANLYRRYR
jgi:hypothetical protein